jgi:hypothetical protein
MLHAAFAPRSTLPLEAPRSMLLLLYAAFAPCSMLTLEAQRSKAASTSVELSPDDVRFRLMGNRHFQ